MLFNFTVPVSMNHFAEGVYMILDEEVAGFPIGTPMVTFLLKDRARKIFFRKVDSQKQVLFCQKKYQRKGAISLGLLGESYRAAYTGEVGIIDDVESTVFGSIQVFLNFFHQIAMQEKMNIELSLPEMDFKTFMMNNTKDFSQIDLFEKELQKIDIVLALFLGGFSEALQKSCYDVQVSEE